MSIRYILLLLTVIVMAAAQSDWTGSGTILDPIGGDLALERTPNYRYNYNTYNNNNYYRPYYYNQGGFFG